MKEAQLERDQIQIQHLLRQVERERSTANENLQKYKQAYKQRKTNLEQEKRTLRDHLDKARQSNVLVTTQLQSSQHELARVTGEVEQWKKASLKYQKKVGALDPRSLFI